MEKEKNMIKKEYYNLKANTLMEKDGMEKEKNMIKMVILNINILMEKEKKLKKKNQILIIKKLYQMNQ